MNNQGTQWLVQDGAVNYLIEFITVTPDGEATVIINGVTANYGLSPAGEAGSVVALACGNKNCLLQVAGDPAAAALYVDNERLEALPAAPSQPAAAKAPIQPSPSDWRLQRRVQSGMGSFITLVVITLVNNILIWTKATKVFPFSLFISVSANRYGISQAAETGNNLYLVGGILVAILAIAFFALLYFRARRSIWPVWAAFGFLAADTALLVNNAVLKNILNEQTLDIIFHVWLLYSLLQLALSKKILQEQAKKKAASAAAAESKDAPEARPG